MSTLRIFTGHHQCILIFLVLVSSFCSCHAQFISHFNSRGIKGNITFDERLDGNVSYLVIESNIESNHRWPSDSKDELDKSLPILFDWSLYTNSIGFPTYSQCSSEDLGQPVSETLKSSLFRNRPVALGKTTTWTLPLEEFVRANSAKNVGFLIWGRSIKLKLSSIHEEQVRAASPLEPPKAEDASLAQNVTVVPKASRILTKPNLNITAIKVSAAAKPTFAPRPKLPLAGRVKPTHAGRIKREVPDLELSKSEPGLHVNKTRIEAHIIRPSRPSKTNSTSTTSKPDSEHPEDKIMLNTHKYIMKTFSKLQTCSSIIDTRDVKTVEASFESQISGKVEIRENEQDTTLIQVNLYHLKSKLTTRHDWKILASDILDDSRHIDKCKYLSAVLDPDNNGETDCRKESPEKCPIGDLTKKHGQLQIAGLEKSTRSSYVDSNLPTSALSGFRSVFLVIYEAGQTQGKILTCAQLKLAKSRAVEAEFNMLGVRGNVRIEQRHYTEPTLISYNLFGLEGNIKSMVIRDLPVDGSVGASTCSSLGSIFNPYSAPIPTTFNELVKSYDSIPAGNLSLKHGDLSVIDSEYEDHYSDEYVDISLQLYGSQTIAGRSMVIQKTNGEPWVCATLDHADVQVRRAVAEFYYPVVGRISFQQLESEPQSETGILVQVYNPNALKSSVDHKWLVHLQPAMADFYNWSARCNSTGDVFDPFQLSSGLGNEQYSRQCLSRQSREPLRCKVGDTVLKSALKISLPTSHEQRTRLYYSDQYLPLSGPNSIIGKSVVIYDDNSPTQRGNRLACSTIKNVHPIKAVVKSWDSGPSIPSNIVGSVKFDQELASAATHIKIDLNGFNGNVENYAIHSVWKMDDREFPCSNDSIYDIYDPYDVENSRLSASAGHASALATADQIKLGDLSRKHKTFEGLQSVQRSVVDANAPLFAPYSVVGRSLVLRAAVNDFRWVCGNIEFDFDQKSSRQIVGMASFDDPRSRVSGFVKFMQIEHKDSSLGDTIIQVDLKLQTDGVQEPDTSHGHNWAIFVNQVGADAFIPAEEVRCIAAGFKWNPYLAQDQLDSYQTVCTPLEHQACAMGDLGQRHGLLSLGPNNRRVLSDSNLPMTGNFSIMARSLIIFDPKRPKIKLGCANIFPFNHLQSNVVIKRTPSFTVARFVEQMRSALDAADWLLVPELKATKSIANGECVQMTIHFYGQKAHQLQAEFNNLVALGIVRKSTRSGSDKISTPYKMCRVSELPTTAAAAPSAPAAHLLLINLVLTTFVLASTKYTNCDT